MSLPISIMLAKSSARSASARFSYHTHQAPLAPAAISCLRVEVAEIDIDRVGRERARAVVVAMEASLGGGLRGGAPNEDQGGGAGISAAVAMVVLTGDVLSVGRDPRVESADAAL